MADRAKAREDERLVEALCSEAMPALEADAKANPADQALLDELVATSMAEWTSASTLAHAGWLGKALTVGAGVVAGGAVVWALVGEGPVRERPKPEEHPVVAPASPTPETRRAADSEPEPTVEPSIEVAAPPVDTSTPKRAKPAKLSAAEMLARADEARVARDYAEAKRRYRALLRAYPRSREAAVARMSAAKLELEHLDNPGAARELYREYLERTPEGNLGEEAAWGLAKAYRALGDRSAERDALTRFLAEFEDSIRADSARVRLEALGVSTP